MKHAFHDVDAIRSARERAGTRYHEFLRVPSSSCGLYHLPADAEDGQGPHGEDEVYHVIRGRARFTAAGDVVDVRPGSLLFVAAGVEHRFHDIEEDLEALVFFAPAEGDG